MVIDRTRTVKGPTFWVGVAMVLLMIFEAVQVGKAALVGIPLLVSATSLYISLKAIRDSKWNQLLVTVEGHAQASRGKEGNLSIIASVEITNGGRDPVTVTNVFWTVSKHEDLRNEEYGYDSQPIKCQRRFSFYVQELPMIIQPKSTYTFTSPDYFDEPHLYFFGRPGATFIVRPHSSKQVTYASTRTHVYGAVRPYPENSLSSLLPAAQSRTD